VTGGRAGEPASAGFGLQLARPRWLARPAAPEVVAVGITTALAGIFYWLLSAPALNPPTYLDPWYYTAFFRNFDYLYATFDMTYYASRLPWIVPGYLVHHLLAPVSAFFVLHVTFALAGALAAYLLLRKFLGRTAALYGYAALLGSLIWWDAYSNDYPDGAVLTYLLVGAAFALGSWEARRPLLRMGLGGFFLAAAVGTNLFAGWLVLTLVVIYVAIVSVRRDFWRRTALDAGAFAAGWLALFVLCGGFSVAKGGRFLFFMPSVRQVQQQNPADVKFAGYGWLREEPRLLAPLFVVAAVGLLWPRRSRSRWAADAGLRFAGGAAASLALVCAIFAVWEFALTGAFLEQPYYFSMLSAQIVLALGGAVHLALRRIDHSWRTSSPVIVAAALPALVIYEWGAAGDALIAPRGLWALIAVLAAVLAATVVVRLSPLGGRAAAAVVVAAGLVLGTTYTAAASYSTSAVFAAGGTFHEREQALSLATQLMRFVRGNGLQTGVQPPGFWFSARDDPVQIGLQSTYLWGWTQVGSAMPRLDTATLEHLSPQYLVLLCAQEGCTEAKAALAAHGYRYRPLAAAVLRSGDHAVDVAAVELPRFRPIGGVDRYSRFYRFSGSPPVEPATGRIAATWSFANALPPGWERLNGSVDRSGSGARVVTSPGRFDYELQGPEVELAPGRYRLLVDGRAVVGGMLIGLLDTDANAWLAQSEYWSRQPGIRRRPLGFDVTLDEPRRVRPMLSNWADGWSSTWLVRSVRIVRLGS